MAKVLLALRRERPAALVFGLLGSALLILLAESFEIAAASTTGARSSLDLLAVALFAQGVPIAGLAAFLCHVVGWRRLPLAAEATAIVLGASSALRFLPAELLPMIAFVPASAAAYSQSASVRKLWLGLAFASLGLGLFVWLRYP